METAKVKMRNIGISAHIDSGKTTITERILYYCKKIHAMHEVRGKDGVGATMDSMELERERGITITSAATNVTWRDYSINIIDTPGHVDFTIEVERALRVLDGAILVLCSVGGVQSQTLTVERQLKRYGVPHIAFINKNDRSGANPYRVAEQLREKLGQNAVLLQIPIGLEEKHEGIVDLITMKAMYFDGSDGAEVREDEIPPSHVDEAHKNREAMMDVLTLYSDDLAEAYLEGKETADQIRQAVRKATLAMEITPVLLGSAYRNKGIQTLLDAAIYYLPSPSEVNNSALDLEKEEKEIKLVADSSKSPVALAFKLEDGQYGQLTYIRIYQGSIAKGLELYNVRSRKKFKVGRLIRMHSDSMEDIERAQCGDIVALFGVDCASGDTFVQPGSHLSMTSMYVPDPVISLSVKTMDKASADNLGKALNRFTREDPTFRSYVDPESNETVIQGMGELHLDVYLERIRREYRTELETGMPQVAYRETITKLANFDYTHKKQTGGAGQFGRIAGWIEPDPDERYSFKSEIKGGSVPIEYIPACDKGFQSCLSKGLLIGFPVTGIRVVLRDGNSHSVDSSDLAFRQAAVGAFRQAYFKAVPKILEPLMKVEVECPAEYQGSIFASLNQRRGTIISSSEDSHSARIEAEVPLSEMFGYSTVLRSLTQGKAEFTMEFKRNNPVSPGIAEELIHMYQKGGKQDG
jgi:elongation factor G